MHCFFFNEYQLNHAMHLFAESSLTALSCQDDAKPFRSLFLHPACHTCYPVLRHVWWFKVIPAHESTSSPQNLDKFAQSGIGIAPRMAPSQFDAPFFQTNPKRSGKRQNTAAPDVGTTLPNPHDFGLPCLFYRVPRINYPQHVSGLGTQQPDRISWRSAASK